MITFDDRGLLTAVVQDVHTKEVLMVAHMNREALKRTIAGPHVWFYSRSRKALWEKGSTSGDYLNLVDLKLDCDGDALLVMANPSAPRATPAKSHASTMQLMRTTKLRTGSDLAFFSNWSTSSIKERSRCLKGLTPLSSLPRARRASLKRSSKKLARLDWQLRPALLKKWHRRWLTSSTTASHCWSRLVSRSKMSGKNSPDDDAET